MTASILGGILLIIGAYFVYKGDIFKSVLIYFVADICWCIISYNNKDYVGLSFIIVGMLLGLGAYLKMNFGILNKTLNKVGDK